MTCHFLLQGVFPTQGSNLGLLHCRQILISLHKGSKYIYFSPPDPSARRGAMVPPPLCTLPPGPGPPRFVCYCEGEGGGPGERGGFNLW